MNKLLLLILLSFFSISVFSQSYENSWINYSQEYYKLKVNQDGINRVSQTTLTLSGLSTATVDPRKIQIFHNGIEQYIYVEGENDGTFDNGDFVEFYGQRNDGSLDSKLYADSNWHPNKRYSLFTDTSVYYLTVSLTTNGKRLTPAIDTTFQNYSTVSPYFIKESYLQGEYFIPQSLFGYNRGSNDVSIDYTESEGWGAVFGNYFGGNHPITIPMPTDKVYVNGPNAEIDVCMGGVNNPPHNISLTFPGVNQTDTYFYQTLKIYNYSVSPAVLTQPTSSCLLNSTTQLPDVDYSMFYWMSVKYPHTYDLEGQNTFKMFIPDGNFNGKAHLKISNFNNGGNSPILYDLTNHRRIVVMQIGGNLEALVDNDNSMIPKECFLSSQSVISSLPVSKISYNQNNLGHFNDFASINADSAFIIITSKLLWSEGVAYRDYRQHISPRPVNSIVVDIDELYDQFSYGIQKHPLSIKNFSHYLLDTWPTEPQHIFLLGKSYSPADFRTDANTFNNCLVPSYGVPTSDVLLTVGINGSQWEPRIPIGRLSAKSGTDVTNYLHKVQEYEDAQTFAPQPWMKEILHFGGGNDINQQNLLSGYLGQYENILEDSLFGGHVTTYLKFSNAPIQINLSDSLQAQIDSGVAIMTFFGHASGAGFDASTDEPTEYRNHGRYPVVVANSCFAGDFHTGQASVSEKFVMEPEKAAIAFLASVGLGSPPSLFYYTSHFFQNASYTNYGATLGQLMKKAIQDIQWTGQSSEKEVSNEMSLQGDPYLKFNNFSRPDYIIDESHIRFSPSTLTTDLDTFSVIITTRNFGRAVQDSFIVKVTHTYPGGADSVYTFKRGRCYYADTLIVPLHTGGFPGAGVNKLKVEIDLPDSVDEYDNYINNIVSTDFFILSKDIIPVYPPDYAIHPRNTVDLKACTANPMSGLSTYIFQIDTIDLNLKDAIPGAQPSPMFRFTSIADSGGVISWSPPNYTLQDSVVYFWRVANDSIQYDTTNFHWQQSSFIYIPNKTGWGQTHFHQYKSDNYVNVRYDTLGRKFDFVHNNLSLRVNTRGTPDGTQTQYNEIGYYLNNSPIEYNGCQLNPAVMVAILDSISIKPWTTCGNQFGQFNQFTLTGGDCDNTPAGYGNCRQRPENYFIYHLANPTMMDSLKALINRVPDNNYIIMYSWFTDFYSSNTTFLSTLTSLGFNTGFLQDTMPFIYFTQKGKPTSNQEKHGMHQSDSLIFTTQLQSVWNRGFINSVSIGPANRWESLHWNQHPFEPNTTCDNVSVNVYGLNSSTNQWDTLAYDLQYSTGTDTSLNWISAAQYPFLKLQTFVQDDSLRTPAQMDYWRIYYDEVPECAINPNRNYTFYSNPLQEGDTVRLSVAVENIGDLPMDSLGVTFYLYDKNHQKHILSTYKMDSLRVGQYLNASLRIDTTFGLPGENSIWVEANPYITSFHQNEKTHFNNLAEVKFRIDRDHINPILDVTFDGVHILNNDIVSGKPNITIQLHDENKFLALNDTTKFKVYMTRPNSNTSTLISWNSAEFGQMMRFTPASLPKNSCRIDWNPTLTEDGIYSLEVEATDRSNNESGKYNYRISFEVINRSTITEVLNYPNPFSTSTRFVFTLTGNEVPSGMKIQIITVSGKVIREIMQHELGNIHIGRNITEYAWDGKDEFGDQLANGLYLYHVTTELHGEKIEHRDTEIDKFFKRGWGKMYLIR